MRVCVCACVCVWAVVSARACVRMCVPQSSVQTSTTWIGGERVTTTRRVTHHADGRVETTVRSCARAPCVRERGHRRICFCSPSPYTRCRRTLCGSQPRRGITPLRRPAGGASRLLMAPRTTADQELRMLMRSTIAGARGAVRRPRRAPGRTRRPLEMRRRAGLATGTMRRLLLLLRVRGSTTGTDHRGVSAATRCRSGTPRTGIITTSAAVAGQPIITTLAAAATAGTMNEITLYFLPPRHARALFSHEILSKENHLVLPHCSNFMWCGVHCVIIQHYGSGQ
jgi:hypothetical protein